MRKRTLSITTLRLALSGAIMGIAIVGVIDQFPYHDAVGAIVGGASVIIAKAKNFI